MQREIGALSAGRAARRERQRQIRELVTRQPIGNQQEFVDQLAQRGFTVTQATVSRDIGDLGLVKVVRAGRHVYAFPEDIASPRASTTTVCDAYCATFPSPSGARGSSCCWFPVPAVRRP